MKDKATKTFKNSRRGVGRSQQELERRIFHLKTLYDLGQEIGCLKGPHEITKNLLMMIMGTFGASAGFVFLVDTNRGKIEAFNQRGLEKNSAEVFSQRIESGYFKELREITDVQILDERDKLPEEGEQKIFDFLSSFNIKVWIPFNINEYLRGGIGLGDKLSGDSYTSDDQELFKRCPVRGPWAL